jgi:signal transduction histidine kinase
MEESGPVEVRALFHAFNQMVIRLAEQQAALHQYAEKALLSQEEERQRISHELHDETLQDLVGLVQRVDLCRDEMDTDPALARRRLDELSALAEQALDDLRRISNALRPPVLQDLGLATAVQSLCDDLTQQMPGIRCNYEIHGKEGRLPPELELAIFRVIQEALSNIRRHSRGTSQVDVMLEIKEPTTVATVRDNGPSFPVQNVQTLVREGHLGLAGMYERARLFNGEISITSIAGEGTTITLSLPVQPGTITYPLSAVGQVGEI